MYSYEEYCLRIEDDGCGNIFGGLVGIGYGL